MDVAEWEVSIRVLSLSSTNGRLSGGGREQVRYGTKVNKDTRTMSLECLCRRGCPNINEVDVVSSQESVTYHIWSQLMGHGHGSPSITCAHDPLRVTCARAGLYVSHTIR